MFTTLVLAQSSPVHVVVSISTDWLTTTIAVAGFVLALAALGWQFYVWKGAGSRVVVQTKIAMFPAHAAAMTSALLAQAAPHLPPPNAALANVPTSLRFEPSPDLLNALGPRYPGVMLVAEIQNRGRMPVTVDFCDWQVGDSKMGTYPPPPPGVSFPHRLGEHDQCLSVIELTSVVALVDAPLGDPALKKSRGVWPIVQLANGRTVRGPSVTVPVDMTAALLAGEPTGETATEAEQV